MESTNFAIIFHCGDGTRLIGPFPNRCEADEYAAEWIDGPTEVVELEPPAMETKSSMQRKDRTIRAEVHTDDFVEQVRFDAEPWFSAASDSEIEALVRIDYGGDYAADEVALFMRGVNPAVSALFDHDERHEVGFEVHVDAGDAEAWIRKNRPALARRILE
jgi:hypothetical protein